MNVSKDTRRTFFLLQYFPWSLESFKLLQKITLDMLNTANVYEIYSWLNFHQQYLRSHFPQEVKHILDVTDAFLPAADDLLPPHVDVTVDSWGADDINSLHFLWVQNPQCGYNLQWFEFIMSLSGRVLCSHNIICVPRIKSKRTKLKFVPQLTCEHHGVSYKCNYIYELIPLGSLKIN